MRFVDAHIHLSDEEYSDGVSELVTEAKNSNVVALVSNSMDLETSIRSVKLAGQYPGTVYATLGIHPWNVNTLTDDELQQTMELFLKQRQNSAVVAIGEIGLDCKYEKIWNKQLRAYTDMLNLAEKLDLPVVIHS